MSRPAEITDARAVEAPPSWTVVWAWASVFVGPLTVAFLLSQLHDRRIGAAMVFLAAGLGLAQSLSAVWFARRLTYVRGVWLAAERLLAGEPVIAETWVKRDGEAAFALFTETRAVFGRRAPGASPEVVPLDEITVTGERRNRIDARYGGRELEVAVRRGRETVELLLRAPAV